MTKQVLGEYWNVTISWTDGYHDSTESHKFRKYENALVFYNSNKSKADGLRCRISKPSLRKISIIFDD